MKLDRYVEELRSQLAATAASSGEEVRAAAEQLGFSLDSTARLALLEALSEASSEITRELAPGSVDVRLRGRDVEFVVSLATPDDATEASQPPVSSPAPPEDGVDEAATSRTTLRLPDHLKTRVERAAAEEGLSVNSWLVRAIAAAVEPQRRHGTPSSSRGSFTGWVV